MPELPEVRFEIAGSVAGRRRYCPDFAEAEESNPGKPKIKFCGVERTDASFTLSRDCPLRVGDLFAIALRRN